MLEVSRSEPKLGKVLVMKKIGSGTSNKVTEDPYRRPNRTDSFVKVEQPSQRKEEAEPVVGFLYSMSHNGAAEYWPLHLGSNTIGKSPDNDICLMEASVSNSHATINIKQMKTTGNVIAFIRDIGSKSGIYLNETELDYEGHSCKNGDIITIGDAYKLLLIIIDANAIGLCPADNFKEIEVEIAEEIIPEKAVEVVERTSPLGDAYERGGTRNSLETIDASGIDLSDPGETKFM